MYTRYKLWAEHLGFKPLSDANFGKTLRRHKPNVTRHDRQIPNSQGPRQKIHVYAGICLV